MRAPVFFALVLCLAATGAYAGVTINGTTITFNDGTMQSKAAPADHGGTGNTVNGTDSFIGGGYSNLVTDSFGTISGGQSNVAGLDDGSTQNSWATVGGGFSNTAGGYYATVPGGASNNADGNYSFAAGRRAKATHNGSFVWGDDTNANISSGATNEFTARASGGVRFFTDSGATVGVTVGASGTSWGSISSKDMKENYQFLDARKILDALANLPIEQWNYKHQDDSIIHIGPYAEDFWEAFRLNGEYTGRITTQDLDGVALAAIQGLNGKVEDQAETITALRWHNAQLEARLARLEKAILREREPTGTD